MESKDENIKSLCNRCKNHLPLTEFSQKRTKEYYKTCDVCRDKQKVSRDKNKCEHGKQKSNCRECNGNSFCEHDKQKYICRECKGSNICEHDKRKYNCRECNYNGSSFCEHDKRKYNCRECNGSSFCEHDRLKGRCKDCMTEEQQFLNIKKNMLHHSRASDKRRNHYDPNDFIDIYFLNGLFEDSNTCHYCSVPFSYNEKVDTLVTIERLDNNIGHTKANCVLAL